LQKLVDNNIEVSRFYYVTNQFVKDKINLGDELFNNYNVSIYFWDIKWLRGHANENEGTIRTFESFKSKHLSKFKISQTDYRFDDFAGDPRIFVFLRQQIEENKSNLELNELLAETLILHALEGTDPDRGDFKNKEEIYEIIEKNINFPIDSIKSTLISQLDKLSKRPIRKIRHHRKDDLFCLPYETRQLVEDKNISDAALHKIFVDSIKNRFSKKLQQDNVRVQNIEELLLSCFHILFKEQGLEFFNFITSNSEKFVEEKVLSDLITKIVDNSGIVQKNRNIVKSLLHEVVRDIIYRGTEEECKYLRKLSNTYTVLFLLNCDPKLSSYFTTMASKLKLLVDNSLIVPAISEYPLDPINRRHWNLLTKANFSGIKLYVTSWAIKELYMHIKNSVEEYNNLYKGNEIFYEKGDNIGYVKHILIRSYFYHRLRGYEGTYDDFVNKFVTIGSRYEERELLTWLECTFGITLLDDTNLEIDEEELQKLIAEIKKYKDSAVADNDAKTALYILQKRKYNKEASDTGIFGFKTWWLSKDTKTRLSLDSVFGNNYYTDIYMRADYINNFIALSPNYKQINETFAAMFPTLLGVSISRHIPEKISHNVRKLISEHSEIDPARVFASLGTLSDMLKSNYYSEEEKIIHFLDEEFKVN